MDKEGTFVVDRKVHLWWAGKHFYGGLSKRTSKMDRN